MELDKRIHEPGHGGSSRILELSSPPPDLIDFSFPQLPIAEETDTAGADIFLLGRLQLPSYESPQPTLLPHVPQQRTDKEKPRLPPFIHRRAGSLDEHDCRSRGEAQSNDYQRLRRASTDPRPEPSSGARWRWPLLVLGSVKFPTEMEIRDMRSRQRRRGQPVVVSEVVNHDRQKSHWSILRALSCKAAENTAIPPIVATGKAPATSSCSANCYRGNIMLALELADNIFVQGICWIPKLSTPHN